MDNSCKGKTPPPFGPKKIPLTLLSETQEDLIVYWWFRVLLYTIWGDNYLNDRLNSV